MVPEVIARTVNQIREERGREPAVDAAEIERLCLELTDSLREEATDRCAQRYATDIFKTQKSSHGAVGATRCG